uniref:Uncharacterized protein n=1 Tax=Megaselia scalaris TaxID=36166 RepID=T1GPK3_MEGSC
MTTSKLFCPYVDHKRNNVVLQDNKEYSRLSVGVLTGHFPLGKIVKRMRLKISDKYCQQYMSSKILSIFFTNVSSLGLLLRSHYRSSSQQHYRPYFLHALRSCRELFNYIVCHIV